MTDAKVPEDAPGGDPIFIVGPQRSGTTLLRLVLDSHPDFACGPETGFMRAVGVIKNIPNFHGGDRWYEGFGFTESEFDQHISNFYRGFFSEFVVRQGKKRWVEKTPFHRLFVADLARLFPDARFVAMTRHPGAVAASRARWGYEVQPVLEDWSSSMRRIISDHRSLGPDRFTVIRYEDLVSNPKQIIGGVLDFADAPWSERVMEHAEVHAQKGSPEVTTGGTRTTDSIDPARIDAWRNKLDPRQLELVAAVDEALLAALGYRSMTASSRQPLDLARLRG